MRPPRSRWARTQARGRAGVCRTFAWPALPRAGSRCTPGGRTRASRSAPARSPCPPRGPWRARPARRARSRPSGSPESGCPSQGCPAAGRRACAPSPRRGPDRRRPCCRPPRTPRRRRTCRSRCRRPSRLRAPSPRRAARRRDARPPSIRRRTVWSGTARSQDRAALALSSRPPAGSL